MSSKDDRKKDTSQNRLDDFSQKIENRFDKDLDSSRDQRGNPNFDKVNESHKTSGWKRGENQ